MYVTSLVLLFSLKADVSQLFYILIGLLVAFGLVSFLSLLRARHRRNAIVREVSREACTPLHR